MLASSLSLSLAHKSDCGPGREVSVVGDALPSVHVAYGHVGPYTWTNGL